MGNRIYFQGVVQEKETPKERRKRKQNEFLAEYKLFQMLKNG
tara:strand:- start:1109 stop:1234 length:126 start_codon:yes stop_codon:yes gene_type:complete